MHELFILLLVVLERKKKKLPLHLDDGLFVLFVVLVMA